MINFDATTIMSKHRIQFVELEHWLYNNVGPGGRWLKNSWPDGIDIEPEAGDEWGVYSARLGDTMISIVDEKKAMLFALRWS